MYKMFSIPEINNVRGYPVSCQVSDVQGHFLAEFWHDITTGEIYRDVNGERVVIASGLKTKKAAVEFLRTKKGKVAMFAEINRTSDL